MLQWNRRHNYPQRISAINITYNIEKRQDNIKIDLGVKEKLYDHHWWWMERTGDRVQPWALVFISGSATIKLVSHSMVQWGDFNATTTNLLSFSKCGR